MFDFSCFFVFHFFVFLQLLVLSVHALYGGPKGSPKWLKITFDVVDFQRFSESDFLQNPRNGSNKTYLIIKKWHGLMRVLN